MTTLTLDVLTLLTDGYIGDDLTLNDLQRGTSAFVEETEPNSAAAAERE
jgi:hypothetical protein